MKQLLYISLLFILFACGQNNSSNNETSTTLADSANETAPSETALAFINAYVSNCNQMKNASPVNDWVKTNDLASGTLKSEINKLVSEAAKEDPEAGLDADPLFDAQDYPDKGFELEQYDSASNYVTLKGIGMPEFRLHIKMIKENNKWLVDGCGIVNIPDNKRLPR